jgi:hypothetical protein
VAFLSEVGWSIDCHFDKAAFFFSRAIPIGATQSGHGSQLV